MVRRTVALGIFATLAACTAQSAEEGTAPKPATETKGAAVVEVVTSQGAFRVELDRDKAPVSVENFLGYVDAGFYDGTVFHRVIPGFMVQGGGFDKDLKQKATRPPIKNEADNGVKNARGTLAMARTSDPNSATAQFFVNLTANDFLDHGTRDFGYAVFGRVSDGMDVVDKIAAVPTGSRGALQNVPLESVTIEKIQRVEPGSGT
jgi:peptidyl-prolyl cis-trans isomerase A (cyclophilin A)